MKRNKKMIRNAVIILLVCFFYFYMNGYYLTKEACIMDTIRGLYRKEYEVVTSLKNKSYEFTIMADQENQTFSMISTKKAGFLYHLAGTIITGMKFDEDRPVSMTGTVDSDFGTVAIIHRNDKEIEEVELLTDIVGERIDPNTHQYPSVIRSDWDNDFMILCYDNKMEWVHTICRVYDDNGEIVYQTSF